MKTLFDKIWEQHLVKKMLDGNDLVHIDRHLLHEMTSPQAFDDLKFKKHKMLSPSLAFAVADHMVSTAPHRYGEWVEGAKQLIATMADNAKANNLKYFSENHNLQGIIHIIAPELGITLPGMTVVCGDSHTCTNGALGAIALGIGTSDVAHVLATQTLCIKKPKNMRIIYEGKLQPFVMSKDVALHTIGKISISGASGYAIEFAGTLITAMAMDERLTLCNLSIELGARMGLIAPDEITFTYLKDKLYAPKAHLWDMAIDHWKTLHSDSSAEFDKQYVFDIGKLEPQITWGTSPDEVIDIEGLIPDPKQASSAGKQEIFAQALDYMQLKSNTPSAKLKLIEYS